MQLAVANAVRSDAGMDVSSTKKKRDAAGAAAAKGQTSLAALYTPLKLATPTGSSAKRLRMTAPKKPRVSKQQALIEQLKATLAAASTTTKPPLAFADAEQQQGIQSPAVAAIPTATTAINANAAATSVVPTTVAALPAAAAEATEPASKKPRGRPKKSSKLIPEFVEQIRAAANALAGSLQRLQLSDVPPPRPRRNEIHHNRVLSALLGVAFPSSYRTRSFLPFSRLWLIMYLANPIWLSLWNFSQVQII